MESLQENERAIIIDLQGTNILNQYLLVHGITVGTVFSMNYSPTYAKLVNLTVGGKMISLRYSDYKTLEWIRI